MTLLVKVDEKKFRKALATNSSDANNVASGRAPGVAAYVDTVTAKSRAAIHIKLGPTRLARESIVAFLTVWSLHARRTRLTDTALTAVNSWVTFLTA